MDYLTSDYRHVWQRGGVTLSAEISPYCWMNGRPTRDTQFKVQMDGGDVGKGGGCAYLRIETRAYTSLSTTEAESLLHSINVLHCSRCQKPAFDPATVDSNREGLCESCFMDDINAKFAKIEKRQAAKLARQDAKMKQQGYTHRVTAWIHPARGDDRQTDIYTKGQPSEAEIKATLKRLRSRVLNDYSITEL